MFEMLAAALPPTISKILMTAYVGDTAAEIGGSLADIAKDWIKDKAEQRRAERSVQDLADQIILQMAPVFEAESRKEIAVEAVAREVATTLAAKPALEVLLKGDLDSNKVTQTYRKSRSLPRGHYSAEKTAFYEQDLRQVVHHLTRVAHKLPSFDSQAVGESLRRLSSVASNVTEIHKILHEYKKQRHYKQRLNSNKMNDTREIIDPQ